MPAPRTRQLAARAQGLLLPAAYQCHRTDSRCQQSLLSFLPSAPCLRPQAVANIMALQRAELQRAPDPYWALRAVDPGLLRCAHFATHGKMCRSCPLKATLVSQ